ncbi:hypothetical protein R5R35_012960 [Gryllus longicercus]|uniref:Calpain-5 n=1 Tax=Gryllus longicercus TaxID=2509291 RepID=A0AAN9W679_9ORTH
MGVGKLGNFVEHKKQKFSQIRKQHLDVKVLFCDPLFPPDTTSVGDFSELPEPIEWKRPKDLYESPRLIDGELSPETIIPGPLSSGWFVAACTVLAGISELCHKVIPDYWKQEWNPEKGEEYAGIFHFHFWRFGQWVDVVVDDILPTFENEIIGTHSTKPGEFWISLVEKAYAKLHGSYQALSGGRLSDALVDFTGGVSEVLDLKSGDYAGSSDEQAGLYSFLDREITHHCIVCALVNTTSPGEEGAVSQIGLRQGGTYLVTGIKKISLGDTGLKKLFKTQVKQPMVRLRDPNGTAPSVCQTSTTEEAGADDGQSSGRGSGSNSAKSEKQNAPGLYSLSKLSRLLSTNPEWSRVKDSDLNKIGLTCDNASEFWLPLEDFINNFSQLTICHLFNTNLFAVNKTWKESSVRGLWSTGVKGSKSDRAGGCDSFPETFLRNPQYLFEINPFEEEIVIQMLQWDTSGESQAAGEESLLISFYIIRIEENRKYRLHKLWDHTPIVVHFNPTRKREIFYRGSLTKGRYIIIPTAHKPGDIGGYFLRIFSNSQIHLRDIKKDVPSKTCPCYPGSYPIWTTVITIKGAQNLQKLQNSCDAYCVVKCEGKKEKTAVLKNSTDPSWDASYVFYRKKTAEPIVVQVYDHRVISLNTFLGQVQLPAPVNQGPTPLQAELMGRKENDSTPT